MSPDPVSRPRLEILHREGSRLVHAVDPLASLVVVPTGPSVFAVLAQGSSADQVAAAAAALVYLDSRGLLSAALVRFGQLTGQEISVEELDASGPVQEAKIQDRVDGVAPAAAPPPVPTPKPRFET